MENSVFQALASNVALKLAFGAVCDLKTVSDEKEALQLWPEMNAHSTAFPQTLRGVFLCPGVMGPAARGCVLPSFWPTLSPGDEAQEEQRPQPDFGTINPGEESWAEHRITEAPRHTLLGAAGPDWL